MLERCEPILGARPKSDRVTREEIEATRLGFNLWLLSRAKVMAKLKG